jgi:ABC-type multidrug transport system fused ATPase/permease subunit
MVKSNVMTRKFTEKEKNILYKDVPIQKQGYEVNWETYLFIILNIMFSVLIFKALIFDYNPFLKVEKFSFWIAIIYVLIVIILVFIIPYLLTAFILNLIRNIIVYSKYRKYVEEYTFETTEIKIFQGREDEDFIIQIFNAKGEKIEIKIHLKISVEYSVKEDFLKEIGNYGLIGSEKIDIPLQDILKIFDAKIFTKKAGVILKDYSTTVKLDSSEKIYYFRDFLKTKYNLVYTKKTNELLFVNFYGNDMAKDIDIMVKDVESKVEYYYNEDRLL